MQISIDLSKTTEKDARRAISAIEAYYSGGEMLDLTQTGLMMSDSESDAALAKLRANTRKLDMTAYYDPKLQEVAAPSTVAATPQPTAPEVAFAQVSIPVLSPPAPPAMAVLTPAPSAPVLPTPPVSGVDVDSEGLPWDARIHASTKTKTQAGVWKKRKGLSDDVDQDAIKRELLDVMAIPTPATLGYRALPPTADLLHGPTPPAAATESASPTTLVQLMPRVTAAMLAKTIPATALLDSVAALGLPSIPSLAQRPDMVPQVWDMMVAQYPTLVQ